MSLVRLLERRGIVLFRVIENLQPWPWITELFADDLITFEELSDMMKTCPIEEQPDCREYQQKISGKLLQIMMKKADGEQVRFVAKLVAHADSDLKRKPYAGNARSQRSGDHRVEHQGPSEECDREKAADNAFSRQQIPAQQTGTCRQQDQILAEGRLDPKVLQRVAAGIVEKAECDRLVTELDLGIIEYRRFIAMTEPVDQLAPKVLLKWVAMKGDNANGQSLHSALVHIGRKDLADSLVDNLALVEGKVAGRTGLCKSSTCPVKKEASTSTNTDARWWLLANRDNLLDVANDMNIPTMEIVDHICTTCQEEFLTSKQFKVISRQENRHDQLRALLHLLISTSVDCNDKVLAFIQALHDVCPTVLDDCIHVLVTMATVRSDLHSHYVHESNTVKTLIWLNDQAEKSITYLPNTCLIDQAEADKLITDRHVTTSTEQERQDYIYAAPAKQKLVRFQYLFQRTGTINQPATTTSREAATNVSLTALQKMLPSQPPSVSSPMGTDRKSDIDSDNEPDIEAHNSFRYKLAIGKRVGIYAGAGCGKTCLCNIVTTSYLQYWSVFCVVLFWRLRDPNVQKAGSLVELLCALGPSWTTIRVTQFASALLATAGRGVLAVLDGVDELEADRDAYVRLLLKGKVLPEARLLVTSRPCTLAKSFFDTYDINLELLGFTDQQVSLFIYQRLGEDLAPKLSRFLDENERLASLMSVPVLALFICEVFRQAPGSLPSTRTALYCKLLALLVRRSVSEERLFMQDLEDVMSIFDVRDFDGKAKSLLCELSLLAEMALQHDKVIFGRQLVKAANCSRDALRLGLVSRKSGKSEQQYSFQHLTIQEFLVSFGLSQHITSAGKQLLPQTQSTEPLKSVTELTGVSTDRHQRAARADVVVGDVMKMTSCLRDVMRQLLSRRHSNVVLQFLAGQVSYYLLPVFFGCLNEWLHQNWCADPFESRVSREKYVESRRRLITCLECVKEASGEEDHDFPNTLHLPQTVRLQHTKASDLSLLAKAMQKMKDVRKLTLLFDGEESERTEDDKSSRVHAQTRRSMTLLVRAMKICECVEELRVYGPSKTDAFFDKEGWSSLCDVVQHTSLKTLYVGRCRLGDEDVVELASALKNNQTLTVLSLRDNKIGDDGVIKLAGALKNNQALTELYLDDNKIGDDGVIELESALKNNQTLMGLYLSGNKIGDDGVIELASALKNNQTLTQLSLYRNKIGDDGVIELASALKNNQTLTHLYLSANNIGDGVYALADVLQTIATLQVLYLHGNSYGKSTRDRLRRQLRHISHLLV